MAISEEMQLELASDLEIERVFQRRVIDGPSHFFQTLSSNIQQEYALRHDIASACEASIYDVVIVGSAKLGFSVKNHEFLEFDGEFNKTKEPRKKSDIDVAVVNRRFFEKISDLVYEASGHFDQKWIEQNWIANEFYVDRRQNLHLEYVKNLARGWLRSDYLPNLILRNVEWPKICESWSIKIDRKIAVAIYSDWRYLKNYHIDHLNSLRLKLNQTAKI